MQSNKRMACIGTLCCQVLDLYPIAVTVKIPPPRHDYRQQISILYLLDTGTLAPYRRRRRTSGSTTVECTGDTPIPLVEESVEPFCPTRTEKALART